MPEKENSPTGNAKLIESRSGKRPKPSPPSGEWKDWKKPSNDTTPERRQTKKNQKGSE